MLKTRVTISLALASLMLLSLFAVLSTTVGATQWVGGTLDSAGNVKGPTSIAVDSTGAPKLCYETAQGLKYAEWIHGTSTTQEHWEYKNIALAADADNRWCALALTSGGGPDVYYRTAANQLAEAWMLPDGSFQTGVVDGSTSIAGAISAVRSPNTDQAMISYFDSKLGLRYAEYDLTPTPHWSIATLAAGVNVGAQNDIASDASGTPYIAYWDPTSHSIKLAYWGNSQWNFEDITAAGSNALAPSIAVDSVNNKVCVIYMVPVGGTGGYQLWYTERGATGGWTPTLLGTSPGSFPQLALDKYQQPVICYRDASALKLAHRDQSGWRFQTIDSSAASSWPSLAMDKTGLMPVISYVSGGNLMYKEGHSDATAFAATGPAAVAVNQQFTLRGTLTTSGGDPCVKQPVHLESHKKNSDGTWTAWANLAGTNTYTDSSGKVSSTRSLSSTGDRQYRWHFTGSIEYAAKYSTVVPVSVKKATSMTMTTSPATPTYNTAFTLSGTLKTGTTGLVGYSVHLEKKVGSGSWADVSGTTKTTTTGGTIPSVSQTMTTHNTYSYRWHFTGTSSYMPCYSSPVKTFTV